MYTTRAVIHIVEVVVQDQYFRTPLMTACENGNAEAASLLLEGRHQISSGRFLQHAAGAAADNQDQELKTALHFAATGGHEYIVDLLLQYGAPLTESDEKGETVTKHQIRRY